MKISPQKKAAIERKRKATTAILVRHLKPDDVITHTRCMGRVEEHRFIQWDGIWLVGRATADTAKIDRLERDMRIVNDIHPNNVTHINRDPLDLLDFIAESKCRR